MAEFDQEPILPDTEMSGSAPVASVINPALVPAVNILSNVGSQGVPAPSSAMDARQRATDVSRFLARQMETLARPDRYGDLINAALMSAANPGRVTVPGALQQAEGQRLNRAYNIANAMSGLARQGTTGQLTEYQRLQFEKDRTEGAARDRRDWGTRTDAMIRSAVSNLDNPSEGIAFFQKRMEELGATRDSSIADLERISRQIFAEFPRQGFAGKRSRDGEDGAGELSGGPVRDAEGKLIGWEPWRATRGRLTTEQNRQNNAWELERGKPLKERLQVMEDVIESSIASASGVTAASRAQVDRFRQGEIETNSTIALIEKTKGQINRGAPVGLAGAATILGAGIGSQITQFTSIIRDQPLKVSREAGGRPIDVTSAELGSQTGRDLLWRRFAEDDPEIKSAVSWLTSDKAADAQRVRTNILLLAFSVARAIDPGGRLSDQDVKHVMRVLGTQGVFTSSENMSAALTEVGEYLKMRRNAAYEVLARTNPRFGREFPEPPTFGRAPAQPASAPQTVPQVPAFDPAKINSLLEKYAPR
jgi:hypothetical protein